MDRIYYKKILVGIRIRTMKKGTMPVTDPDEPLQMLTLKHPKGKYLLAHMHAPKRRTTLRLQECLIVKKGRIRVELYGPDKISFKNIFLNAGEAFILMNGGFGIHILRDAELMELKNGPYKEDKVLL